LNNARNPRTDNKDHFEQRERGWKEGGPDRGLVNMIAISLPWDSCGPNGEARFRRSQGNSEGGGK